MGGYGNSGAVRVILLGGCGFDIFLIGGGQPGVTVCEGGGG